MVGAMCACVVKVRFESAFRVKDNSQRVEVQHLAERFSSP